MLVTRLSEVQAQNLARGCPSVPFQAGHRVSPEFANIQSIAQDAYFAGLFDGEGCVSSQVPKRERTKSRTVVCQVVMTEKGPIEALANAYGGKVFERDMRRWSKNAKEAYQWSVSGKIALNFMRAIFPHAICKRQQLEIAILIQESIGSRVDKSIMLGCDSAEKTLLQIYRNDLALKLSELKHVTSPKRKLAQTSMVSD
jgi:hypothetical protein